MAKTRPAPPPILQTNQTFGCVFAFESALTLDTLAHHYANLIREKGIGRHIDVIGVLDRGVISLAGTTQGLPWAPMVLEGFGGAAGEGAHVGVSSHELGENSLDVFLRLLLAQLIYFRAIASHPGFNWGGMLPGGQMMIEYVTSITHETDPIIRAQKLKKYAEDATEQFKQTSTSSRKL